MAYFIQQKFIITMYQLKIKIAQQNSKANEEVSSMTPEPL